jgi:hypothetical protein
MKKFSERLVKKLNKSPRQREPDEDKYPWLSILLNTYHIYDVGLEIELEAEEKRRGLVVACRSGCCGCCLRPSAPVTELEILGIWWFVIDRLENGVRTLVQERLLNHRQSAECPFLLQSRCAIYSVRPLACRILYVFGAPCKPDEVPVETRPDDIWTPSRDVGRKAAMAMLTYFGFTRTQDKVKAFDEGFIPANSRPMYELQWESLALAKREIVQASP